MQPISLSTAMNFGRAAVLAVLAAVAAVIAGCAAGTNPHERGTDEFEEWTNVQSLMLNMNHVGGIDSAYAPTKAVYEDGSYPSWSEKDCRDQYIDKPILGNNVSWSIDRIMKEFHAYAQRRKAEGKQTRVMLLLHGGLVGIDQAIEEARRTLTAMGDDRDFFPIFLNWDTSIEVSYFDHLLRVREGRAATPLIGYGTAPFIGVADLGRAVGRTPIFLYRQAVYPFRANKEADFVKDDEKSDDAKDLIPKGWRDSVELPPKGDQPKRAWVPYLFSSVFPGIFRVATTPVADFAGTGAYENMRRRARLLFLLDRDFRKHKTPPCGALSRLAHELRAYELLEIKGLSEGGGALSHRNRGDDIVTQLRSLQATRLAMDSTSDLPSNAYMDIVYGSDLENDPSILPITIVAHSMGGIVANEFIHRNGDLFFDNVVYMAAANTIADFAALAIPYLKSNPTTIFYSLSLHPFREVNEINGDHMIPEGSLLVWLDRFLIGARSELDKTFGTWNNVARALPIMHYLESDVRKRLRIKVFDSTSSTPQRHGDFNNPPGTKLQKGGYRGGKYWDRSFWQVEPGETGH